MMDMFFNYRTIGWFLKTAGATHFAEADGEFMAGRKAHSLGHGHPTSPETPPVRVPTGKSASMATLADSPHSVHEDPYNQDAQSKFATPSPVSESFVPAKKGRISVEGTDRNPIFVTRYDETPESAQHDVAHGKMVAKKKANSCAKSTTDEASMVDSGNKYDKYYHQFFDCMHNVCNLNIRVVPRVYHHQPHPWFRILNLLRMRRYVTPRKDGTMLASPDAIKMWRTESGRPLGLNRFPWFPWVVLKWVTKRGRDRDLYIYYKGHQSQILSGKA